MLEEEEEDDDEDGDNEEDEEEESDAASAGWASVERGVGEKWYGLQKYCVIISLGVSSVRGKDWRGVESTFVRRALGNIC